MKLTRIICAVLFALVCAPALRAQTDGTVDGVTAKDGQVYAIQNGTLELLTENLKLPFEVEVNTNGTYTVAGGNERKLQDGQIIRRDGWLLNPDGSIEPVFDHVAVKNGKVWVVRDGQAELLTSPTNFPNHLSITPDGWGVYPDGSRLRLMDGQLFRLDGTSISSKDTVTLKNGVVVVQKGGTLFQLSPVEVMGMYDGTRVYGNGTVEKPNGTTFQLQEGQTILLDGVIVRH